MPCQHIGAPLLSVFKQISTSSAVSRSATGVQTPPAGPAAPDLEVTILAIPAGEPLFVHVAQDAQDENACKRLFDTPTVKQETIVCCMSSTQVALGDQ